MVLLHLRVSTTRHRAVDTALGAATTTFVSTNFEQPKNQGHDSPAAPSGQTTFIFESPRLDIGHSTHLPHIPLQPKHSQSTARAQLEHSQSASRAQPEHSQSTAKEHSQSEARAQPEHSQSTARVQPEHSQSTVGDSRGLVPKEKEKRQRQRTENHRNTMASRSDTRLGNSVGGL